MNGKETLVCLFSLKCWLFLFRFVGYAELSLFVKYFGAFKIFRLELFFNRAILRLKVALFSSFINLNLKFKILILRFFWLIEL